MYIKKPILIALGIAGIVLVGALSFAIAFALSHANQPAADTTTPTSIPTAIPTGPANRACVLGVIQSIGNQSFVVSENQGRRTVTVTVNEQTTYARRGGQVPLSFSDLKVGERVRVTVQGPCGRQTTTVLAQSIIVLPPVGSPTPTASPTPAAR